MSANTDTVDYANVAERLTILEKQVKELKINLHWQSLIKSGMDWSHALSIIMKTYGLEAEEFIKINSGEG